MDLLRAHARRHAWIALLAVLATALLPALARAFTHAQGDATPWTEICTSQGLRPVALAEVAGDTAPAPTALPLEHCALCLPGHAAAEAPPAQPAVPWPPALREAVPVAGLNPPAGPPAWPASRPRGPPPVH